jgi:hypothetical protein
MSRTNFARRLTAVIVLLAGIGLALPAAAGAQQHTSRPHALQTSPGLFDQLLSWLGTLLPTQAGAQGHIEKADPSHLTSGLNDPTPIVTAVDRGAQVDPNGGK